MKQIVTYLTFNGNCREAMDFYAKCLGGDLHVMPFSDMPGDVPKEAKERVMHARLDSGPAVLMASDTMPGMGFLQGNNVSVSVQCESLAEVEKIYSAFAASGTTTMPLADTFWGARFGMLTDQFGVHWMFHFEFPKEGKS